MFDTAGSLLLQLWIPSAGLTRTVGNNLGNLMALNYDSGRTTSTSTWTVTYSSGQTSSGQATSQWSRKTAFGVDIPHYHRRKAAGELLPHTSFSKTEGEVNANFGTYFASQKSDTSSWARVTNWHGCDRKWRTLDDDNDEHSVSRQHPVVSPEVLASLRQAAAASIQSKGWDALTFAGELPSLRRMLKNISKKSFNLAQGHSSKRILQLWLEGRYGWRTLAYDIRDFSEALAEFESKRDIWSERQGTTVSSNWTVVTPHSGTDGSFEFEEHWNATQSLRGAVSARISPPQFQFDPLKTGWELVPYSFVLDWVINVGQAIDALRFISTAVEYTASSGVKSRISYSGTVVNVVDSPTANFSASGSKSGWHETISRSPSGVSTVPYLTNRSLTAELGLDLIALFRLRARL